MRKNMKKILASVFGALALAFTGGAVATANFTADAAVAPYVDIVAGKLRLADNVEVMFGVETNVESEVQVLVWESAPVEYTYEDPACIKLNREEKLTTLPSGEEVLAFVYDDLTVKEMAKQIYVCAYAEVDGKAVYSEVFKYGILDYAFNTLQKIEAMENPSDHYQKLEDVIYAMLNYGAAMQLYAGETTDFLANGILPDADESYDIVRVEVENATFSDGFNHGFIKANSTEDIQPDYGYSLVAGHELVQNVDGNIQLTVEAERAYYIDDAFKAPSIIYYTDDTMNYAEVRGLASDSNVSQIVIASTYEGKPVTTIKSGAFANEYIASVSIPASITTIEAGAFVTDANQAVSLSEIIVEGGNTAYTEVDGNLYSKDGKTFVQYAIGKADTMFTVPAGVVTIADRAFAYAANLTAVELPIELAEVEDRAFRNANPIANVYYNGTESAWANVSVGESNISLTGATVAYYDKTTYYVGEDVIETQPVEDEYVATDKVSFTKDEDVTASYSFVIPAGQSVTLSCVGLVKDFSIIAMSATPRKAATVKVSVKVNGEWVQVGEAFECSYGISTENVLPLNAMFQEFKIENISTNSASVNIAEFAFGAYFA